jgi:hypothetical protein
VTEGKREQGRRGKKGNEKDEGRKKKEKEGNMQGEK